MRNSWLADQGGAALIEATLVLPLLLLLVAGIAETSLFFWTNGLAGKAVQLGLRRAVVSPPVAVGFGLEADDAHWAGLPPGMRCGGAQAADRCPSFHVRCRQDVCTCPEGGSCGFRFERARLSPILEAMQAVLPDLRAENVEVSYITNGFGYAARPGPVPVDVEVRLVGYGYRPVFAGDWVGRLVAIRPAVRRPGESLGMRS